MILNSLRLTDFGTFKGSQELILRPKPNRPIVLFGGKNGAGKSTILEAIRLCFYGSQALGNRVSKEQYLSYLRLKIHRNPNFIIQPNYASLSLEFEYADLQGIHTYRITRGWQDHGTKITEDFQVEQDGKALDEVSSEHWQDFIRDLIPIGVSQLFFFDGEKIQELAEDSSDQGALMTAVKLLLGVDVVERLDADLGVYLSRTLAQRKTRETGQLATYESGLENARASLKEKTTKRDQALAQLSEVKRSLDAAEQQLASSGGNFAQNREGLLRERHRVKTELAQTRADLREMCADLLPFALCQDLCLKLRSSLQSEEEAAERRAGVAFASRASAEIRKSLPKERDLWPSSVDAKLRRKVAERITELLNEIAGPLDDRILHGCSVEERRNLLIWIERATTEVPLRTLTLSKKTEQLSREEHRLEAELKKIPEEDTLRPMLSNLQQLYKELAELEQRLATQSVEIQGLERSIGELTNKCKEESNQIALNFAEEARIAMVPKVRATLDEFKAALILRKIRSLEDAVTDCFNVLCRKKDHMRRISIDPSTFRVTIKDKNGDPIPKAQLSAGEKQVYAISMLWALGKTSGRPLPVIVDTPLARLDRDHRTLLAEHYFPNASHQVLVLSTDTEVDEEYFERLAPSISKAYLLSFDQDERFTSAGPGYFWRKEHEVIKA